MTRDQPREPQTTTVRTTAVRAQGEVEIGAIREVGGPIKEVGPIKCHRPIKEIVNSIE